MLHNYIELLHLLLWIFIVIEWSQQNTITFINVGSLEEKCDLEVSSNDSVEETISKVLNSEICERNDSVSSKFTSYQEGLKCLSRNIKFHFLNNISYFREKYDYAEDNIYCYLCITSKICSIINITETDPEIVSDAEVYYFKNRKYVDFCEDILENCTSFGTSNNENVKWKHKEHHRTISLNKLIILTTVLIVCFISLLGNGMLVIICTCHRKMRTDCNKIILNLAISDIFFVLLNCYSYICDTFLMYTCVDLVFFKTFSYYVLNCVCSYNVAALSLQRYLAVVSTDLVQHKLVKLLRPLSIIAFIWVFSVVITFLFVTYLIYGFGGYQADNYSVRTEVVMFIMFAIYCFIPLLIIIVCSITTSYQIKKFYQEIPGEAFGQERIRRARIIGSNVLIALVIVFIISYVPYYFIVFIRDYIYIDHNKYHQQRFSKWLVILNSVFNPLALYVVSGKFRKYFNQYILFVCKHRRRDQANSENATIKDVIES